jgi:hypothetical protein
MNTPSTIAYFEMPRICMFCHKQYGVIKLDLPIIVDVGTSPPATHGTCDECATAPQCLDCGWPKWYCDQERRKQSETPSVSD